MIKGVLQRFLARRAAVADRRAMFARRAMRVCNRKQDLAAKYERVHEILAKGPK